MEFLPQQNRRCEGDTVPDEAAILATGKHVVIIGGGDTGADCLGTSHRQGAASVHQFELLPKPPDERSPLDAVAAVAACSCASKARTKKAACAIGASPRRSSPATSTATSKQLHAVRVGPPPKFEPIPGTRVHAGCRPGAAGHGLPGPVQNGMIEQLGVKLDARGNVATDANYMTSRARRFRRRRHAPRPVAGGLGDRRRPQGRAAVDRYLALK